MPARTDGVVKVASVPPSHAVPLEKSCPLWSHGDAGTPSSVLADIMVGAALGIGGLSAVYASAAGSRSTLKPWGAARHHRHDRSHDVVGLVSA
jgi:hypothetical protein